MKLKAYIASYLCFLRLIITSSTYSGAYLERTRFLSDYNSTIYENYIQFIYRNTELRNRIINNEQNLTDDGIDSIVNCDISLRFMRLNAFQLAISVWMIGFFWNEFKQIINVGLRVYLKTPSKSKKNEENKRF